LNWVFEEMVVVVVVVVFLVRWVPISNISQVHSAVAAVVLVESVVFYFAMMRRGVMVADVFYFAMMRRGIMAEELLIMVMVGNILQLD